MKWSNRIYLVFSFVIGFSPVLPTNAVLAETSATEQKVCLGEACFAKFYNDSGSQLPLLGVGLFEYLLFDVYTGAFYSANTVTSTEQALRPEEKTLVLHYHRSLTREDFIESSEELLKKNPNVNLGEIRPQLRELYAIYKDVAVGDRYSLHYHPQRGTTLSRNGIVLGTIVGEEFQAAYFGIWLSNYSVSSDFTQELLGLRE